MSVIYINSYQFAAAPPSGYDPDAQAYITAVEAADTAAGSPGGLEAAVKDAINAFVVGCKADGIWNAIKASCILAGARTLDGALQPLVGTAPTNPGGVFTSADYNRKTGLKGNGSTKYLASGYAFPTSLQNNCHITGFFSEVEAVGFAVGGYGDASANGSLLSAKIARLYNTAGNFFVPSDTITTGFRGISRNSAASFLYRTAGADQAANIASASVVHQDQGVFARRRNTGAYDNFSNPRLAFYSIGEALSLSLLDARVTTLINAFAAAIP